MDTPRVILQKTSDWSQKEIGHYTDVNGCFRCIHVNKELALENIRRIRGLLSNSKVQVLIAHDVPWYKEDKGGPVFYPGEMAYHGQLCQLLLD
jgi:hypothetical protein